jgi:hypothetical protein
MNIFVRFSGHTALWVILSLCYLRYENSRWMKLVGVFGTLIGMMVLVASKAHYTVDVVVGAWVSSTWWLSYYIITKNILLPDYKTFPVINILEDQLQRESAKETEDDSKIPLSNRDNNNRDTSNRDPDEGRMLMLSTPLSQRQHNQQALLS